MHMNVHRKRRGVSGEHTSAREEQAGREAGIRRRNIGAGGARPTLAAPTRECPPWTIGAGDQPWSAIREQTKPQKKEKGKIKKEEEDKHEHQRRCGETEEQRRWICDGAIDTIQVQGKR